MTTKTSLDFQHSPDFQNEMLALMLQDTGFARKVVQHIPQDRLFSEAQQYLFGKIKMALEKHSRVPTFVEIEDNLKTVEKHRRRTLKNYCKEVFAITPKSTDFIKETVTDYAKRSAFIEAFQTAQTLYNSKKQDAAYDVTLRDMTKLMSISFVEDEPISIEDFEKVRLDYLREDHARIPTGLDKLDQVINGGLAVGELGAVLAGPKVGKSQMLVNFGVNAILREKTVLHFVLEGLTSQTIMRYQSRLTNIQYNLLKGEVSKKNLELLKQKGDQFKKRLLIESMNTNWNYTPEDIEGRIDRFIQKTGKPPDLVIVDYGDLVVSINFHRELRHQQKEVYQKLKTLAMKKRIAIWTATQANRQKEEDKKKNLTDASVSDSIDKARIFDLMISLGRTDEERGAGVLRIHVALYRDGASGETIYAVTDYTRSTAYSKILGWFTASELRAMKP